MKKSDLIKMQLELLTREGCGQRKERRVPQGEWSRGAAGSGQSHRV